MPAKRARRYPARHRNPGRPKWLVPVGLVAVAGLVLYKRKQAAAATPCCGSCAQTGGHCGGH